ncbi:hypothetical protein GOBAR_AA13755 [Gossypium barbadense]|uniref:Uncharacterized protein n=1 Tax=Gossypium barbadense TaxID=3634 RepID=A0A2P5XU66_GOSBA|nr:hypothetical protein GOBAR_AA13755 [Gossypium barbadense]
MTQLESDMEGQTNTSFRQWLGTMEPWQWAQSFDEGFRYEDVRDAIAANHQMARSMTVEVYSRCNETFRVTETIGRRPISLNVEQFIDEVYTHERTLRVWENEFPVLPDLSTWEVPPMTFELIPDKGLRRNPKGHPQSSRIHNEMDIREKSDEKLCGVCRLTGHNRSKCPLRNYHVRQSSQLGRN